MNLPDVKTVFSLGRSLIRLKDETDFPLPDSPTMASVLPENTEKVLFETAVCTPPS
jgi:hypothetical protein